MIATQHSQSVSDFSRQPSETLDRLERTGEAEVLTMDGEARAVLLSPTAYGELLREAQLTADVAVMRRASQQLAEGKGRDVDAVFKDIRARLLEMKDAAAIGEAE